MFLTEREAEMSITPIEIATMAPKSQETSLMKNAEVQKPNIDNMNANLQMENKVLQNGTQTVKAKHNETPEFRYDAKNKGNGSYSPNHGKKEDENKKKSNDEKIEDKKQNGFNGHFDIRI